MSNKPVILIACNRVPYPLKDGGAMAMYALIKAWHDEGKQVHVVAMNTSRHRVSADQLPPLFREIAGFEMVDMDTDIHLLPLISNFLWSKKPQHAERFYNKHFEERLITVIKKIQPDIIQLESIYLQEYVPAIRSVSKAIVLQRLHNIEGEVWSRLARETKSTIKKFYLSNLAKRITQYEQKAWKECDGIIPISNNDAAYIGRTSCTTPSVTIPYGIVLKGAQPDIAEENWTAYHIGAMDWQPNVEAMDWMRDAIVPVILKQVPDFDFQFAGRNMPERFDQYKEKYFYCVGEVNDATAFIAQKKILIVPLRSGSGIRIKTLEAMAAGKLVISTSVGIQGIEALDKIHFLQADTPAQFAEAISWSLANKKAAAHIAQNAADLLEANHNQKKLMQKLAEFVEKLS